MPRRVLKVARNLVVTTRSGAYAKMQRKKKPAKSLITTIKRISNGQAETKYVADNYDRNAANDLPDVWTLNDLGLGAARMLPMIPRVSQGTDENERVGDSINPVGRLMTNLMFSYTGDDVSGSAIKVEIWYGTTKARKSWDQNILTTDSFLDNGDGTNSPPGQNREQTLLPTDKRIVSFRKKTFILSKANGVTGGDNGDGNFSANGGKFYRSVRLYHKPPKKLKYGDATDEYPTNYAPGYFINYSYVNGKIPATSEFLDSRINISSRSHMHFKDL